ncbi:MAG: M12 family metallopeptidase [Phycisphaerales bacterium]
MRNATLKACLTVALGATICSGANAAPDGRVPIGTLGKAQNREFGPQFFDTKAGIWWSCGTDCSVTNDRSHISGTPWNVVQDSSACYPGTNIIIPYRIVTEGWFGDPPDADVLIPDEADPNDPPFPGFPIEDMAVAPENIQVIFNALETVEAVCDVRFVFRDPRDTTCHPNGQPNILFIQSLDGQEPFYAGMFEGNTSSVGMQTPPFFPEWTYYDEDDDPEPGDTPMGEMDTTWIGQIINIESWTEGVIVHEVLHAMGFLHEHQRADRDTYVTIFEENVNEEDLSQFTISNNPANQFGDYDFESIMHYSRFAFSADGGEVIRVNQPWFAAYANVIGNRGSMSVGDAQSLQALYGARNCPFDLDMDVDVDRDDLDLFLGFFMDRDARSDVNGDGLINAGDFYDMVDAVFGGAECFVRPPQPIGNSGTFDPF